MTVISKKTKDRATAAHQRYLLKSARKDLDEAINCYIELLRQDPTQTSAYYRLATLLHESGQIGIEGAINQCKKAIRINPDDANAHIYLGYFLSLNQQYNEASKEFHEALKINPLISRGRIAMALTSLEKIKNADKKSIKDYTSALYYGLTGAVMSIFNSSSRQMLYEHLKDDLNFATQKAIGEFFETIKSDKKAYDTYLNAVDDSEKSISMYEKMAQIALKKNRPDIAFDCLNNVVILSKKDPLKIVNAIEFTEKYQPEKIDILIDYYTALVNYYPELSKCYYELGHLYLKKNEQINALSAFKLALKYENDNPYYQNALAYAYVQLEQYDCAIELYQKALEKNPNDEWSSVVAQALATIYHQIKGNNDAAISMLENALHLTQNKAPIYEALADIYYDDENLQKALDYYQRALDEDSENPKLNSRIAMVYWELDFIEKAIIYYSRAIELDNEYDIAYNNLGVVFLDGLGDLERAQTYFLKALELNHQYVLAHFNLARCKEAQGLKIDAAKEYQLALNINQEKRELDSQLIEERLYKLFET
ncbi:tetratricopeptide repeat protein [bacterium]|nr:tetratricopeptide repeat protein [bacterium]